MNSSLRALSVAPDRRGTLRRHVLFGEGGKGSRTRALWALWDGTTPRAWMPIRRRNSWVMSDAEEILENGLGMAIWSIVDVWGGRSSRAALGHVDIGPGQNGGWPLRDSHSSRFSSSMPTGRAAAWLAAPAYLILRLTKGKVHDYRRHVPVGMIASAVPLCSAVARFDDMVTFAAGTNGRPGQKL